MFSFRVLTLFLFFLYRVWVQVLLKKGESTFEILISIRKTLFGMMSKMEVQLRWHSVRKKLRIGRSGFVILRCEVYQSDKIHFI